MNDFQKVKKIVKILTQCSSSDANLAAQKICQDPDAIILLGIACSTTGAMTVKGLTAAKVNAVAGAFPFAIGALAVSGATGLAAKRFCTAVINQTGKAISNTTKSNFENSLSY